MKRKELRLPTVETPETCCWCGAFIGPDQPVWGVFATSFFDLRPKSEWIEIELLTSERIVAGIPGKHSQARKDGWDIFFEVCSPDCARSLDTALRQNTEAFFKELKIEWLRRKKRR